MQKVLITGGTGLIGKQLSELLESKGYEVRLLSRKKKPSSKFKTFLWNIQEGFIDKKAFSDLDFIVHLAGAGIADKKWSDKRKQVIIDSRVKSTELLLKYIRMLKTPLKAFLSSSAVGIYGSVTSEIIFTESDNPGNDYLAQVCKLWENSVFEFEVDQIRTVAIRTGIVLSAEGGALEKMNTPVITSLGSGMQYMPWIHIDDLCEIYLHAIEKPNMKGTFNGVAPEHESNKSFSKKLAFVYKKPFIPIGVPAFLLKMVFGEMATILLNGSRISSEKIIEYDFKFKYASLNEALRNLKNS